MQITVTFDSLDEFKKYMGIESPSQIAQEAPKESKVKKNPPKAEKPQEETAEKSEGPAKKEEEAPAEAPAEVNEDFRVEVRKTLAKLNKKVGKNMASELIKEYGVEKLTEVSLEDLPALMDKAKEALNAE